MKTLRLFIILFFSVYLISCTEDVADKVPVTIIPKPVNITEGTGEYAFTKNTKIYADPSAASTAEFLAAFLRIPTGYNLPVEITSDLTSITEGIVLTIKDIQNENKEAYILDVTPDKIVIAAGDPSGLFNGTQSLRQLFSPEIENLSVVKKSKWLLPVVSIKDEPYYRWRGYMQDVSRTFYNMEFMKKYLDVMSLYKLNTLHFHLTDDQGWRIEIKKYPKLTSAKATTFPEKHNQPAERSGFYTQEQIKELVAYAAERNITIVPEIDVPGHCWPVILEYPELGVNDVREPDYVMPFLASWSYWGFQFTPNPLDPTKEEVYTFLDNIFTEVAELFPGEYIHFGGDEVVHRLWESEPHVQAFMKEHKMKDVTDLQSYFVNRVAEIIINKGKKPMGWSDILKGADSLNKEVAMMSWLGDVKSAVTKQFKIVAAPAGYLYFDITQKDRNDGTMSDLAYGNINSIERIYGYDPSESLTAEEKQYVLGVQANQWPAVPQEIKDINVQNFPRILVLSEIAWLPKSKRNYDNFMQRLENHYPRLDEMKIDYYTDGGYITGTWSPEEISTDYKDLEWDVSQKVYANGRIIAGFYYTNGESFLNIKKVQLLEDGKVISEDIHEGLADDFRGTHRTKTYQYNLKVDNYNPTAVYTVRAEVAGTSGTDSYGNFTFNLSPYKPFTVTRKQ
ncbi:MAG: beta-N-acetylhexosaminidase [Bacteroidales bacterium]|nr:beta-N-acetylhexosaminidase [Bacteroidales bacterium]